MRGRRDYITIALATAGVLAAISLAGIFIVYLVDTISGDDKPANAQVTGGTSPTGPTFPGGASLTGPSTPGTPAPGTSAPGGAGAGAGAAGGGAAAQGTGAKPRPNRIPDNQQYDTFTAASAGYSISHPMGWPETGTDKNKSWTQGLDFLHVVIGKGPKPTVERQRVGYENLRKKQRFKVVTPPTEVQVNGQPAIKATILQGKKSGAGKAFIYIDQYRMESNGRTAAIDIACPRGVYKPNTDDFKKMIDSFRWK